jgi:alkylation response protein AidB-like acyl-CoA dehydrogenase
MRWSSRSASGRPPCCAPSCSRKTEGHLRADADERQVLFEIHGLILALHYEARFLQVPGSIGRANVGFDNILRARTAPPPKRPPPPPPPQARALSAPHPRFFLVFFLPFLSSFDQESSGCLPTTHPCATCSSCCTKCSTSPTNSRRCRAHAETDADTINAVIEEAGKFAAEVTFPLNISGDEEGCTLDKATHEVKTPKGFKDAYAKYVEGGWPALSCDPAFGGQGLPFVVNQCLFEMLNSANQAWTMYPGLSHGAYEALVAHGTDEQKKTYLPKLTSGEWTGTMCLTEPHCGTDLGLLRTKAEPQADGTYRITGNKIFISAGEHDMTDNIIHLVLARLPDAPKGSKGISLFVVPKFNVKADGSLGERNPIFCGGLEHKMGIHGNATAQIVIEGAVGTLVGEPNKGLAAMFVMMNAARLGVGNQSLGLTEVAYQNALAYAKDRIQMRSLSGVKAKDKGRPDHRAPRRAQDAAHRQGLCRRRPRAADLLHAAARQGAAPPRREGAQGLGRTGRAAHAHRQGLHHRQRPHRDQRLHAGVRRPRLHQGMGHGAVRARQPHQHDLRGHQHHPVAGPAGPQGAGQQRRVAEEVRQAGGASWWKKKA